jgi:hypothetical protein
MRAWSIQISLFIVNIFIVAVVVASTVVPNVSDIANIKTPLFLKVLGTMYPK